VGNVSKNVHAKLLCTPLRIKKALEIFYRTDNNKNNYSCVFRTCVPGPKIS